MWAPLCLSAEDSRAVLVSMLHTGSLCEDKMSLTCVDLQINVWIYFYKKIGSFLTTGIKLKK